MDEGRALIFVAIITAVTTFLTMFLTNKVQRRAQNLSQETSVVDNYQEDIKDLRAENAELRARMDRMEKGQNFMRHEANRVVDEARDLYYAIDEEVIDLRRSVDAGTVPPLPLRPPRKPFPALNFSQGSPSTS